MRPPFAFTVGVAVALLAFTVLLVAAVLAAAAASVVVGRIAANRSFGGGMVTR